MKLDAKFSTKKHVLLAVESLGSMRSLLLLPNRVSVTMAETMTEGAELLKVTPPPLADTG